MQELKAGDQDLLKGPKRGEFTLRVIRLVEPGLDHLDVPVAELVPHKVVDFLDRDAQLEFVHVIRDSGNSLIHAGQDPFVLRADTRGHLVRVDEGLKSRFLGRTFLGKVHHDKSGRVPDLVGEVSVGDDSLVVEAHIVAGRVAGDQRHAQRVRAVIRDDLQRINAVSEGLGHLASLGIPDKAVEKNALKRSLSHLLVTREDHSDDPEENDVIAGDQDVGGIEIFEVFCLLGPAQCTERPQGAGEPGVQCVGILGKMRAAALRADGRLFFGDDDLAALIAVISGNSVAPPELTADAPVADVVRPVEVGLLHALGDQLDIALFDALDGGLNELVHLDEPLLLDQRLDGRAASVMCADIVAVVFNADKKAHLVKFLDNLRSRLISVHAAELAAVLVDGGVVVHDVDLGQVMALSDLEVVGVVGGRDLDDAGTEFPVDILVGDDRDLSVHERKPHIAADQVFIAVIFGMNGDGRITQHGLGTGGGKLKECGLGDLSVLLDQGILDVPEMARLLLVLHFRVGNRGVAHRAPVDDPASLVDPPFLMHLDEDFRDGFVATLIHCEALAVPVAGRTQLFELVDDPAAVLLAPVPAVLEEFLAAQVLLADALLLEVVDNLDFRRNGSVVRSGLPEGVVALHALPADQDILHGIVQGVAHVKLTCDIRRRDHDREGRLAVIHLGVEVLLFLPVFIDPVLNSLRIISLGEHLSHFCSLLGPLSFVRAAPLRKGAE